MPRSSHMCGLVFWVTLLATWDEVVLWLESLNKIADNVRDCCLNQIDLFECRIRSLSQLLWAKSKLLESSSPECKMRLWYFFLMHKPCPLWQEMLLGKPEPFHFSGGSGRWSGNETLAMLGAWLMHDWCMIDVSSQVVARDSECVTSPWDAGHAALHPPEPHWRPPRYLAMWLPCLQVPNHNTPPPPSHTTSKLLPH